MDCQNRNIDLISAYVDGTANSAEKQTLETHMEHCSGCAREVRELVRTRDFVRELPTLTPSPRLMPAISQKLRELKIGWLQRLFWGSGQPSLRASAAIAGSLFVCLAIGVLAINGTSVVETPRTGAADVVASAPTTQPVISHLATYQPPATTLVDLPLDDYENSCVVTHAAYDRDEAVWAVDAVMLARP